MSVSILSETEADALTAFVEPYVCPIQTLPKGETLEPPGRHIGTGWFFEGKNSPSIVTCEHVAKLQNKGKLGYSCLGWDFGISIQTTFNTVAHPVDAAIAGIANSYRHSPHNAQCATKSLFATRHAPVQAEWLFVYGFPGADAAQAFGTQRVVGSAIFLQEVKLSPEVIREEPPHPVQGFHICLAWNPEIAQAMLGTSGALSLPKGMSGSPLWNTRYVEITQNGGTWKPSDAVITGMVWGHSSKAGQLYATPIEAFADWLGDA